MFWVGTRRSFYQDFEFLSLKGSDKFFFFVEKIYGTFCVKKIEI